MDPKTWAAIGNASVRFIIIAAMQKGLSKIAYEVDSNPGAWTKAFGRWLTRSVGGLAFAVRLQADTDMDGWMYQVARIFLDTVSNRIYDSSAGPMPDYIAPLLQQTQSIAPVTQAGTNQGVNQNQGTATINRFAKQIIINNPVSRMTKAKKDRVMQLKMTPEERKQKKKEYMAQKRAEAKQAAETIQ
jgi:hypothetical protein